MRYFFGDYTLDTERHELLQEGGPVKLRPKVFRVLAHLVAHRDRMVPKGELLETIWPQFVSEEVLNSCVMAARRAVGDDGRAQSVIKTTHGLGYRFVAPVSEGEGDSGAAAPPEGPEPVVECQPDDQTIPCAPARLPVASPRSVTEHKTVTVLACKIIQGEDLASRLGAEAMHELMETFFAHARTVMNRHEGTVVQWLGDGFLALFGAPLAHEDDARRAVLAALELNAILDGLNISNPDSRIESGRRASMGLNTGPVVVGQLQETHALQTYTARGATTDLAVLLQSAASPGCVLISETTYRLVEAEITAKPSAQVPDMPRSYQLLGVVKRRAGVPRRIHLHTSSFVGRSEELAILHERLARAGMSDGQVICVTGVAGIGKSRLLSAFCSGLPEGNVTFLKGYCLPYGKGTPYRPIIDLVRDICAIGDSHDAVQTTEKVRAYLDCAKATKEMELLLLELLGVPIDGELLRRLSPQARRTRTFSLLQKLVFDVAAVQPTVVIIEDLHWIDATSEEWLGNFVARLGDTSILLLVTYRAPYSPDWLGRSSATQLALPPLTHSDSATLIQSMLSQTGIKHAPTEDLIAKAEGNPFFLEELTYALETGSNSPQFSTVPDTVQAVLAARIDQLEVGHKQVLQTCSVIGTPVPLDLLRHVAEQDTDALDLSLGKLEDAGFLVEIREIAEPTYRFKHALTQEATYQSLPMGARAKLHSRIAEVLEQHFGYIVTNQPEVLARHHARAANVEAAVHYWQRAGRKAYERSANIEAISYSTQGLELLAQSAIKEGRAEKELSLQLTLAPALMAAKGYGAPEVEPVYNRARSLCEEIGDEQQLFRALIGSWNFYWVRGELDTARDVASRLIALAERADDPARALRAHAAMGEVLLHVGELEASLHHLQRGIELYEATRRPSLATQVPEVGCQCYAAWSLWHLGHSDQSLVRIDEAVSLADRLGHPMSLALCLTLKAELHQFRLEVAECRDVAEQAVVVSREQGFPFWEGTAMILLGWAQAMAGDFEHGHRGIKDGLKVFVETGARVQRTAWLGMLAEIRCHSGHFDEGLRVVHEALTWVGRTGEQYYLSELHRLEGELLCGLDRDGNAKPAEEAFGAALDTAHRQGAKFRELRAAVGLAQLWRYQGRDEEALKLIRSQQPWPGEASSSIDVKNARAFLDALC